MPRPRVPRHEVVQPQDQSYKLIPLTQGLNAIVDTADFEWLSQWNWSIHAGNAKYAARLDADKRRIFMHRLIMGFPEGKDIDHRNGNKLDNRRCNLRQCTRQQNTFNKQSRGVNQLATGKGKWKAIIGGKWRAQITVNGQRIHLGYFLTEQEAVAAHNKARKKFHGDFFYQGNHRSV